MRKYILKSLNSTHLKKNCSSVKCHIAIKKTNICTYSIH